MKIIEFIERGTLNVSLYGKFTFVEHEAFRIILGKLQDSEIEGVVLNLKGVEFIDSAAMGMLLLARDEAGRQEKELLLAGAGGQVRKMFDMANFQNLFTYV